jgi:hypothetical protein
MLTSAKRNGQQAFEAKSGLTGIIGMIRADVVRAALLEVAPENRFPGCTGSSRVASFLVPASRDQRKSCAEKCAC